MLTGHFATLTLALTTLALVAGCNTLGLDGASDTPTIDRIRKSGEIRIGTAGDYPPLTVKTESGAIIGLDADLARALAIVLDVDLDLIEMPFAELLPAVQRGDLDAAISGITMTPPRNMDNAFAGPYFVSRKAMLAKSDTLADVETLGDLATRISSVAALNGGTSQHLVTRDLPNLRHVWVDNQEAGIEMVRNGKVDVLVADYPICGFALLRHPTEDLALVEIPHSNEPIGIAVSADDVLFLNLVENYLSSLEGIGLLSELRNRWFEDPAWLSLLPKP